VIPTLAHIANPTPRGRASRSLARRTADALGSAVAEVLANDEVASRPGLMQLLDPRVKLVSILVFAVTASLVHSVPVLLAMAVLTVALAAASRVAVDSFLRKVWAAAGFFGVLLAAPAVTAWITPGLVLVPLGPASITYPGLLVAARLVLRVAAGAGFGLLVVLTTRWTDLLAALTAMRVPDLVVATLAMTQQQIMSLLRTVENMHLARESRMLSTASADQERGWVVERMAFVARKSLKTADDVYDAMLARGFSGAMPTLSRLATGPRDWTWLVISIASCAAVLAIDRMVFPV
jgi:cobalt/nickel transport system permease protein